MDQAKPSLDSRIFCAVLYLASELAGCLTLFFDGELTNHLTLYLDSELASHHILSFFFFSEPLMIGL